MIANYAEAQNFYQEVIEDITLETYPECFDLELEGSSDFAKQYAAFKLVLLSLMNSDSKEADRWVSWTLSQYPSQPLAQAAQILLNRWLDLRDLSEACDIARQYLTAYENPTGTLEYTGYANPTLTTETVCHF